LNHIPSNRLALLSTLLVLGVACRDPAPPPAAPANPPRITSETPGGRFDLSEVMRRVHFAYRQDGEGWKAGHSSWSARATANGLTFTPRHALEGSRILTGAPVTFGAAAISRGAVRLDSPGARGTVREDGTLALVRGEVAEELLNSERGIEQRWRFTSAPRGEGELLLRVPVRGLRFAGETSHGVHFADAAGLGVRYGNATWTDAMGKKTEIPARAVSGAVELRVPAELLASSAFPTLLAPTVSPEFGLDTPVTDPGGGAQTAPAIASNGSGYLAVWADDRAGDVDIYGARVSAAGAVLDTTGIAISTALNAQQAPAVAFDGTNYFVVWSDGRRGSGTDIYGARVSQAGAVLDAEGTGVSTSTAFNLLKNNPALVFDGTNYLVIWEEQTSFTAPTNLFAAFMSPTGTPVGTTITVSTATGNQREASLAFDGTNFLAAWQDERAGGPADIYAARISQAGSVLDITGFPVSARADAELNPAIQFNGTSYFVVWEDYRNAASGADLYGARVSPAGSVQDPLGLPLIQAAAAQSRPALVRLGTGYLLAWQDQRTAASQSDVYASRVNAAGSVLDGTGIPVTAAQGAQHSVAVATNGTDALLAWHDARTLDIIGARLSGAGTVLDANGFTVSRSANSETNPAVAFDGTNYLVVWQDNRGNGLDIYGVRVSGTGTVLDASGLPISTADGHQRNPALVFNGSTYLVTWEDTRSDPTGDIYGARVNPAGTVLDASGLALCARAGVQQSPAVSRDSTNFLLVWEEGGTSTSRDIYGTRISPSGAVLDPLFIAINTNTSEQTSPVVAFDGTNYLVAWSDYRNNGASDVYGARVSQAGAVLDAAGLQLAGGTDAQTEAALAFNGANYLLVWSDYRLAPHSNLFARRVRPAGTLLDATPITVSAAAGHQQQASVTFNASDFFISWQDGRGGTDLDIYGGRITPTGVVLDGDGFPISESAADESQVALAGGGAQGVLAVYQATDNSLGRNVQRLKARRLSTPSNTPPTADAQSLTTDEDQPAALELSGSDPEGNALTFAVATLPANGTLSGTSPKLIYTPAANFSGTDSFTFTASDGQATSAPATVSITVNPVNDAPTAAAQSTTVLEDTPKTITLTGTDLEGDALTFAVATGPAHGTLSGTPPSLTYTPATDYIGPDSFTFTASDGQGTSTPATVSITVIAENDPPEATAQSVTTNEDTPAAITLTGVDQDGDALTYAVTSQPANGTLTGTPPSLTYTPAPDYNGPDSFTFTVSDGLFTSAPATVSITVTSRNDRPVALAQSITTAEDVPQVITLTGTDVEGTALTFTVVSGPSRGTLSGTPPSLTYTPALNTSGPDSFTFTASDGQDTSAPATVSITVTPVNDAPVPAPRSVTTPENTAVTITLTATDPEGDAFTYAVASQPAHGTLTGTPPVLTYTPAPNYNGPDSFTFTASDAQNTSAPATVSITVSPVNSAPTASAQSVTTAEDTPVTVTLSGTDLDGDSLAFNVTTQPTRGTLSGTPPALTYRPSANFNGTDSFTFTASDGNVTSARATVSLTITPVNDAPVATARTLTANEDTPLQVTLAGTDVDGDPLTFTVSTQPTNGTLSGTPPALTYTPAPNYIGTDSFTFTASDGQATSAPATVSLNVVDVNDAPVAQEQRLTLPAGTPSRIYLDGTDADGDALTFNIVSHPETGRITGNLPDAFYTPPANFVGTTRFTFSANDGKAISSASVEITVVERSLTVGSAADSIRPAEGQQVRFYANAVDKGGAPITLEWNFGDGQTSQEELPVHAFAAAGTYEVRLKATTATEEATTTLRVRVRSAAIAVAPSAQPAAPASGEEGATLSFRVDQPDAAFTYTWDFGDGSATTTGATASHGYADDGRFTVKVTATDSTGTRWTATRALIVHNAPPVGLPQDRLTGRVGEALSIQLSGSDVATSNDPLTWELVSGEGSLSQDGTFRFTPSQEGLATVVTKVLDGDGGEARLAFQISSSGGGPTDPGDPDEGGCGCGASSGGTGALGLGLLLLGLVALGRKAREG
jgi:VCBS repeat-containing protein